MMINSARRLLIVLLYFGALSAIGGGVLGVADPRRRDWRHPGVRSNQLASPSTVEIVNRSLDAVRGHRR